MRTSARSGSARWGGADRGRSPSNRTRSNRYESLADRTHLTSDINSRRARSLRHLPSMEGSVITGSAAHRVSCTASKSIPFCQAIHHLRHSPNRDRFVRFWRNRVTTVLITQSGATLGKRARIERHCILGLQPRTPALHYRPQFLQRFAYRFDGPTLGSDPSADSVASTDAGGCPRRPPFSICSQRLPIGRGAKAINPRGAGAKPSPAAHTPNFP
jgi:hypothetical protein